MYLENRTNPSNCQGHGSQVKVTEPDYRILFFTIATSRDRAKSLWTRQLVNRCTQLDKFSRNMYLDNLYNPVECQGHRSKVRLTWVLGCFSMCVMLQLPAVST